MENLKCGFCRVRRIRDTNGEIIYQDKVEYDYFQNFEIIHMSEGFPDENWVNLIKQNVTNYYIFAFNEDIQETLNGLSITCTITATPGDLYDESIDGYKIDFSYANAYLLINSEFADLGKIDSTVLDRMRLQYNDFLAKHS